MGTPIERLAHLLKPGRASPAPTKLRGESLSCYCFSQVILALSPHVPGPTSLRAHPPLPPGSRTLFPSRLRQKKAARPPHQPQHCRCHRTPASPRHRPLHRAKNPRHPQILRRLQKRRRSSGHQGHRPQKTGKNAQVPDRGQNSHKKAIEFPANCYRTHQTSTFKKALLPAGNRKRRRRAVDLSALPASTIAPNFFRAKHYATLSS
jgi:hypothetical protein